MACTMKAAQLMAYGRPLETRKVPVPGVRGQEVLVRVEGSGLCHSDLHIIRGRRRLVAKLPFTLGHENSGTVERLGEGVPGLRRGDPVVVYGGWSKLQDKFATNGEEQLSNLSDWVGFGQPGGYAEYLLVPSHRYLLPAEGLEISEASVLTDAGLTPYRAFRKLTPSLDAGSTVVIIGSGGLGQFAIQYARLLAPGSRVVAIDANAKKLAVAKDLGAEMAIDALKEDLVERVKEATDGEGAQGVIDFVGTDSTLNQAFAMAGRRSKVVIVGLGGGTLKYPTGVMNEVEVTTSNWGSLSELADVVALAKAKKLRFGVKRIGFAEMNTAFDDLEAGRIDSRAVLVPGMG
jgi:alcohol dehydrogenase, propanol-preferring